MQFLNSLASLVVTFFVQEECLRKDELSQPRPMYTCYSALTCRPSARVYLATPTASTMAY